jgi:uncharacterized delta-60 repeat protein
MMRHWIALLACILLPLWPGRVHAQPCSLDPDFNPALNFGSPVYAVALQPDGQILIGGSFQQIGPVAVANVARLNQDGTLDATFNPGTAVDEGYVNAIAVQPDGKILLGGYFSSSTGSASENMTRLNPDGTVDMGFDMGLYLDGPVNAIVAQADGTILIGGGFQIVDSALRRSIARLNSDGTLDVNFDACVAASAGNGATALSVLSSGKILASGNFTFSTGFARSGIARLNVNGDLDTTYAVAQPGISSQNIAYSLAARSTGKAVLVGDFRTYRISNRGGIVQMTTNGTVDSMFNPGTGINNGATNFAIALQSDGKALIGGTFSSYNEASQFGVARINPDGTLDTTCDPGLGPNNAVSSFAIQKDGRILVAGRFSSFNGEPRTGIARLRGDPRLGAASVASNGALHMTLFSGDPVPWALQSSPDLVSWMPVTNFTVTSTAMMLIDPTPASSSNRFYRVVKTP